MMGHLNKPFGTLKSIFLQKWSAIMDIMRKNASFFLHVFKNNNSFIQAFFPSSAKKKTFLSGRKKAYSHHDYYEFLELTSNFLELKSISPANVYREQSRLKLKKLDFSSRNSE